MRSFRVVGGAGQGGSARPRKAQSRINRRNLLIGGIVVGLIILFVVVTRLLNFYIDYLWFGEVGFRTVLWRSILFQLAVGAGAFALFFLIVWPNVEIARRSIPEFQVGGDVIDIVRGSARRWLFWIGLGVCLVAALIAGVTGSRSWLTFVKAFYGEPFGRDDPIFGHDLGFYVFSVPAWHAMQQFVFAAVIVALLLAALIHLGLGGAFTATAARQADEQAPRPLNRPQMQRPNISFAMPPKASMHLSALLGVLFVIIGIGQFFKMWGYLQGNNELFPGAGYTDVHARIPAAWILMGAAFLIAALLFFNMWRRVKWWPWTLAAWVGIFILAQLVYPAIIQGLVVNPNQLVKEREYIAYGLNGTRRAYKLDQIEVVAQPAERGLSAEQLEENQATVRNVRLWDPQTLLTSYRQLQELRPYYSFVDVDVDRYRLNGQLRQTMLSPRELSIAGLPAQAQTWVNQHITYTHGYGVALSAVNQVTPDGSPDFLIKDIPPSVADVGLPQLRITQPRIYYGEIGTDYTLVGTKAREFDRPGPGNRDVFTRYQGSGGVEVSSFWRRLALTWRFRTLKFFTSTDITAETRIILRNNIVDRLAKAAPFLRQDADPYMVVADGRLFWVVDCYTATDIYPYSESDGDYNYIRNSVKAVIDAYNGTLRLYVFDPQDPILKTYQRSFPGIFTPMSEVPRTLMEHVRYPEGYFNAQSRVYATYHVTNPATFYERGDQWQIPNNVNLSGDEPMPAFYVVLKLPGQERAEFTLILPYVPNGRPNMLAWLGARSDVPAYGEALTIEFSQGRTVYGPAQAEAAINQDPVVSSQKTLWNQAGSRVLLGNLLVTPIEDSLLYVQPLYLQSERTELPQLKQVVVFYRSATGSVGGVQGQYVSMKPTLGEALEQIFGTAAGAGTPSPSPTGPTPSPSPTGTASPTPAPTGTAAPTDVQALIQQANQQFDDAQAAQRRGDWAEYGRLVEQLRQTLQQLSAGQQ